MTKKNSLKQLRQDYQSVFGTPTGKRVLADMRKHFFVDRTTHVPGDSHGASLNEGLRMAFLHIMNRQRKDLLEVFQEDND